MIIRPTEESDLPTMARWTRDALSFASSPDPQQWTEGTDEELIRHLHGYLPGDSATSLVVEVEGAVIGYVACSLHRMAKGASERRALIDLLAVAQTYRNHGLGTHMVRELHAVLAAQGIQEVDVNVNCLNEAAVRFWRRAGFHERSVTMTAQLTSEKPR